jgi:tRNA modification GTPase
MDGGLVDDLGNLVNRFNSFLSGCVNKNMFSQKNNVLLVGPVNSGKSSVFNRLLGFERAIVSNTPGTTRDIISSELFYESSVFSIQDSAGIRETDNKIEGAGIDLSLSQIKSADLVMGIFDLFDKKLIKNFKDLTKNTSFISVQNKTDVNKKNLEYFDCCVSAKTGDGFDDLKKLILSSFNKGVKKDDYKFMIRDRHNKLFQDVIKNLISAKKGLKESLSLDLVAEDLRLARSCLDELVGEKFSDSLLGDIFSSYCIGK